MRKLFFIVFLLTFTVLMTSCNKLERSSNLYKDVIDRDIITVGVKNDTKPFGYMKNGELIGFDVDLAKLIAKELLGDEKKVKFVPVTPTNRIMKLNTNKVDMVIATMTRTPMRWNVVDFSVPYYMAGQAMLASRSSKITSMAQLNGKKVIVIFGTTAEKNVRTVAPEAVVLGYKTYDEGFSAIKRGIAEVMTADDTVLYGYAISDSSVKLLPKRYSKEYYSIAFRKGQETQKMREKVDEILENLQKSGKINQLKNKWINM